MTDNLLNKNAKIYVPKSKKNDNDDNNKVINTNINKDDISPSKSNVNVEMKDNNNNDVGIKKNGKLLEGIDINSKPYIPNKKINGYDVEGLDDEKDEDNEDNEDDSEEVEIIENQLDQIIDNEIINQHDALFLDNEEDEISDEDKWYPKFANCECCKGYLHKCENEVCKSLSICYCKAQEDYDPEI